MASIEGTTVVISGKLLKRGEYISTWRPRWFVLRSDGTFRGYKQQPANDLEPPINLFEIQGCTVKYEDDKAARTGKFGFIICFVQATRVIERAFHTEIAEEREKWVKAIRDTQAALEARGRGQVSASMASRQRAMSYIGAKPEPIDMDINSFDMLKVLGKGTFGKVMLARLKQNGQIYAIKLLKKSMVLEKDELAHTLTENHVLAKCTHPFLTSLHYSFQTSDLLCFVLEYVNGGELFFHLRREKRFGEDRVRLYIAQILMALTYLHGNGIIYRDLKLENLMLDRDGYIKITDFGLCKEEITYGATTNTFCGTPEYLAPEVIVDSDYGRAVDWWGLGVVAFEMIAGKLPFESRDYETLFNLILTKEVEYPPTMSETARDMIAGLLDKEPSTRLGGGPRDGLDIQAHAFFASLDFDKLIKRQIDMPFKPKISSEVDTANFDPYFTSEAVKISPSEGATLDQVAQSKFKDFEEVKRR